MHPLIVSVSEHCQILQRTACSNQYRARSWGAHSLPRNSHPLSTSSKPLASQLSSWTSFPGCPTLFISSIQWQVVQCGPSPIFIGAEESFFSPQCLNQKPDPLDKHIPPQESQEREQLTLSGSQAHIPMAHSRDSNPKCLLSPRAKIPTISREEMKCHWEELLGRQKFGVRPLRQEARTSKNKNWGGVTGRTKTFQGAHWQRKHQNSALSQSKRLQRDYTAQSLVCDMKGPSL